LKPRKLIGFSCCGDYADVWDELRVRPRDHITLRICWVNWGEMTARIGEEDKSRAQKDHPGRVW
jgi:hypothetical protein